MSSITQIAATLLAYALAVVALLLAMLGIAFDGLLLVGAALALSGSVALFELPSSGEHRPRLVAARWTATVSIPAALAWWLIAG